MITSSHLQTLCEVLGDKPKYSIEMYLERMDMNHAVQMKGILQNLGYSVDLKALLTGNENIIANRIPITNDKRYEKRYDKTFQNFELEEMGIPTGFSIEEWKMVQEHDESMKNMDRLESIFSEKKTPNINELIEECQAGKYHDVRKSGSSPCYAIDNDFVLVHHKNIKDAQIFAEFYQSLSDEDRKNIFTVVDCTQIEGDDRCWELQTRAHGEHFRGDAKTKEELLNRYSMILQMPSEHIRDFFKAIMVLGTNKMEYDSSGNNVLYDENKGFQIIDLDYVGKRNPDYRIDINDLLGADNYQTMDLLLGINRIPEVRKKSYGGKITETERDEIIPIMKETLKKIVMSVYDLEYGGQKMTYKGIQSCLEEYKKYGIELSVDEIFQNKNECITQNPIGKSTVSRDIKGINLADKRVNIEQEENETPITDATRTRGEEEKETKTDPYIRALLNRLIKSGGIIIPSSSLKVQQGNVEKITAVPSEASIKGGYKARSLEGVYGRRNIKTSQVQKAHQVISDSIKNKDEQQNEQEGGTDYDQH